MSLESIKAAQRAFFEEVWNAGDLDAVGRFITPEFVNHDPSTGDTRGIDANKELVRMYRTAFPDLRVMIDEMFGEGDMLCTRWHTEGTHQGELAGIAPTGKRGTTTGISIDRFEGDLVAESWNQWDNMGLMVQLGALPEPAAAHA